MLSSPLTNMPKRVTIQPHLQLEELKTRYRQASDPVERSRYHIIWLMAKGKDTSKVAEVTGYSAETEAKKRASGSRTGSTLAKLFVAITKVVPLKRVDRRHQHIGGQPLLSDDQQAQLWLVLCGLSPDGGLWNGRKVADWMGELIGRAVSRQRGWEYLQHMKFRLRTRLPQHQEVDLMELEVRKKKLAIEVELVQTEHPEAEVELWAMDEHRIGLKPVIRDMWVNEWEPPIAKVNWRFKWLWLYGFVCPESGETYWWILPFVNIKLFNRVLADFAKHYGVSKNKRIVLTIDQAFVAYKRTGRNPRGDSFGIYAESLPRVTTSRTFMAFN